MMLHRGLVFSFLLVFCVLQSQASTDLKKSPSDLTTIILSNLMNKVFRLDHEMEEQRKLNNLQQEKLDHEMEEQRNLNKLQQEKLDHEMEEQRNLNKLQQEKNYKLNYKIIALEKQLAAEHDKHRPIAFHVILAQTQTARPAVIVFNKVISNYGNGWNNVTHHFVAPEKGLYLFYLSFLNVHKVTAWAEIRRGATRVSRSNAEGGSYNTGTCSTVLQLQKGEHVSAWLMGGQILGVWTHFVGTLIQA